MLSADEVIAAVRVHADRVHDAVRRLGCGSEVATQVVEKSALSLIEACARQPESVGEPVGWWFAKARALGRQVAGGDDDLPVGGGLLSSDANQARLAEALESRPERERAALLLRDSYDLPPAAVGTSLGLDAQGAMEVVAAARLAFLPSLLSTVPRVPTDHNVDLAALARLAEGGQTAARDATTRRHVRSCERCADLLDAQERARRMLAALTVVALPDRDREALLARVESRARALLPAAGAVELVEEWDDEPARRYPLSLLALGVVLAVAAGIGGGILASRGSPISPTSEVGGLPLVTAAPVLSVNVPVSPTPTSTSTVSPSPRVFIVTPSPTPTPTTTATATGQPTATEEPLGIVLNPSSGPADTEITVTGQGWPAGASITLNYFNAVGGQPGATSTVVADSTGHFTTNLTAHDQQGIPGQHQVTAEDGQHATQATFNATS